MSFLGSCKVCGKLLRSYRGVASHLRPDRVNAAHGPLREEWLRWRDTYRVVLKCRKCGVPWEVNSKSESNRKRCPSCCQLRRSLGKLGYEKHDISPPPPKLDPH